MAAIPDIIQPGDVISSDLFNRIIQLLNDHDALLAGGSVLSITHVQPVVVRMGEELKVFGSGLEVANLKRISIEGTEVGFDKINPGATGEFLSFNVPAILGIPDAGKTVVLTVENKAGATAIESFYLLPGVPTNLEASFNIVRTTVSPLEALAVNKNYDFTFSIEAFTSLDETYLLEPKLLGASAGWTVAVKGGASEILIPKSQPTPSTTPVVITVHTGGAGSASLTFGIRSKNFGKTGSSQPDPLAIGSQPGAANLDVKFLSPKVLGSVQKFANGSLYIRTDATVANQKATVNPLDVVLSTGGVYTIGAPVVGDAKWTITVTNNPMGFDTTGTPGATKSVIFTVAAQAGAPDADAEIPITGAGALPDGSFKFKLKLRADPSNPSPI
jgi:hypothetical protein